MIELTLPPDDHIGVDAGDVAYIRSVEGGGTLVYLKFGPTAPLQVRESFGWMFAALAQARAAAGERPTSGAVATNATVPRYESIPVNGYR